MNAHVWTIAHRGASAEAPESTAAALARAMAHRVDMVELDVQLTRDNRLVIFHDDRLDRTTDGRGPLIAHTYRQLTHLDAGSWFGPRFAGQRVLLVSQALRQLRCRINLELKPTGHPDILIRQLLNVLHWTKTVSRVLISSFDVRLLRRVRRAAPRLATALLHTRDAGASLNTAIQLGCVAFHPHASLVTPSLVRQAHEAGLRLHTWTVDSPAQARRLIQCGVDGIVTNHPERLKPLLDGRAHRPLLRRALA